MCGKFSRAGGIPSCTENKTNWIVFVWVGPMLLRIVRVEVHLANVCVCQLANFQIDYHKASQSAVKKQQIDSVPNGTNQQSSLAANKREISAKLQ